MIYLCHYLWKVWCFPNILQFTANRLSLSLLLQNSLFSIHSHCELTYLHYCVIPFYVILNQIWHLVTSPDLLTLMNCLCTCLYELHVCEWFDWKFGGDKISYWWKLKWEVRHNTQPLFLTADSHTWHLSHFTTPPNGAILFKNIFNIIVFQLLLKILFQYNWCHCRW